MNLATNVSIPSLVRVKSGAIDRLGIYLKRSGHTPVLVLASEGLVPDYLDRVTRSLAENGIACARTLAVEDASFEHATQLFTGLPRNIKAVVGLGGGKALAVDLVGSVLLTPAIVGCLRDSDLATNVRDSESLGQIAVCFAQDMRDFLGGPSPAHESLRNSVYRRTPISAGPDFGEQASREANSLRLQCTLPQRLRNEGGSQGVDCLSKSPSKEEAAATFVKSGHPLALRER
jgi:hypothetical protein